MKQIRRRWKHNSTKIGWEGVDWIHMTKNGDEWCTLTSHVMNHKFPQNSGNILINRTTTSFSKRFCSRELIT